MSFRFLPRWRWYRYRAVTVGRESGERRPLDFVEFRHAWQADRWCRTMNAAHPQPDLVFYAWERKP